MIPDRQKLYGVTDDEYIKEVGEENIRAYIIILLTDIILLQKRLNELIDAYRNNKIPKFLGENDDIEEVMDVLRTKINSMQVRKERYNNMIARIK